MPTYRRLLFAALAGLTAVSSNPGRAAAHGGGGHGGGGHAGGGHPGNAGHHHPGAPIPVYRRGYYGAVGFYPGFYGFGPLYGLGYPGYFGGGLGGLGYYGPSAPYYIPGPPGGAPVVPAAPSTPVPGDNRRCVLDVRVPVPDAEVVVGGHLTRQQGTERRFLSPALVPGEDYAYTVTARWNEDGKVVERTRTVTIQAGQEVPVDFVTP